MLGYTVQVLFFGLLGYMMYTFLTTEPNTTPSKPKKKTKKKTVKRKTTKKKD